MGQKVAISGSINIQEFDSVNAFASAILDLKQRVLFWLNRNSNINKGMVVEKSCHCTFFFC